MVIAICILAAIGIVGTIGFFIEREADRRFWEDEDSDGFKGC